MRLVFLVALLMPTLAFSECYVVSDIKGYSARQAYDYAIDEDGLSDRKIAVEIDGAESSVTPRDMACNQAGKNTILCVAAEDDGESTIVTWAVYPEEGKAVHTKSRNGFGAFNGGNLFVGKIAGRCE